MSGQRTTTEEVRVTGEALLSTIKGLVHEGNIRRITIKNDDGKTLIEIPMTLGVVGAILMPQLAAIGAIAALATNCTILVERSIAAPPEQTTGTPAPPEPPAI